jgi:hypothetical protein
MARKWPKLSTFGGDGNLKDARLEGFGPYISRAPHTAYVKPKIPGNNPVLDEKYLFV